VIMSSQNVIVKSLEYPEPAHTPHRAHPLPPNKSQIYFYFCLQ
jgi:hypothetical protein